MTIWLTTDWHLKHFKIMEYENRPEGFEDIILNNILSSIQDGDKIINLGDCAFSNNVRETITSFNNSIKSKKNVTIDLIRGNHDSKSKTFYESCGFDLVTNIIMYGDILLSHKPRDLSLEDPNIKYNIHGHFHSGSHPEEDAKYKYCDNKKHILLGLENVNYELIDLDTFNEYVVFKNNKQYIVKN